MSSDFVSAESSLWLHPVHQFNCPNPLNWSHAQSTNSQPAFNRLSANPQCGFPLLITGSVLDTPTATHTRLQNGFIIGDGEFRDSKDPENERCLRELMEGNVPRELEAEVRQQFPGAHQVGVNLVNRTQEEFVPPKPKFDFAKSQGQSLGDGAAKQAELLSFAEAVPRQLDPPGDGEKAGAVQLVLADKRKLRLEVARGTRVLDVFQHAMSLSGLGADEFVLVAGFPPKPLEDPALVLAEHKLVGSSFAQRLVQKQ